MKWWDDLGEFKLVFVWITVGIVLMTIGFVGKILQW